jgi:exopolysaccharide biosynthesis protein
VEYFDAHERALLDAEAILPENESGRRMSDGQTLVKWDFALESRWVDADWIMGGALLMVDDGRTELLHHAAIGCEQSVYRLEGWSLESSQRTQETPVETDLREARTTMGLTTDGQFFLAVIEGRANNRLGATHIETVNYIRSYFKTRGTEVRYALDLDSASSVSLGVAYAGQLWLLNQTARGSDSKLGDTRFFNHVAFLTNIT